MFWLAISAVGYAGWQLLGKKLFSLDARDRRRRRRNYGRAISGRHGPNVKLAVKVGRS